MPISPPMGESSKSIMQHRGLALLLAVMAWMVWPAAAAVPKNGEEPLPETGHALPLPPAAPGDANAIPPLPPEPRIRATPAGNPGEWVTPDDYPDVALRFGLGGVSAFRLYIGPEGAVDYCDITASSGLQLLDDQTCILLRERAHFTPARDARGQAARDVYTSRVIWKIPSGPGSGELPLAPRHAELRMLIDRLGKISSCSEQSQDPEAGDEEPTHIECGSYPAWMPASVALAARGYGEDALRWVGISQDQFVDGRAALNALTGPPGTTLAGAMLWQIDIQPNGQVLRCTMTQQKGNALLIVDICQNFGNARFEAAPGKNHGALRTVWAALRYYYKTGP